ncbi:hypothetical protein FXF51_05570 [Nonomuraea sp. PA05]|uniref:WD40 repeat domain-containing protein n=1 Tax=Nonomuraea sp. PA05 TaxID=2604466 RepID=UPI0011D39A90|nr:hypothetical protein FXF51_05570 [Nonomuraea sp. PA05]
MEARKGLYDRPPLRGQTAEVLAVRIGRQSDGTRVVMSGSSDGTVRVWDLDSGTLIGKPLRGHKDLVMSVAVGRSCDGTRVIVSSSGDKTIRV